MKRVLFVVLGIAALAACGGPQDPAQPNSPPDWPLANLTEVSPRSHGSAAKARTEAEAQALPSDEATSTDDAPADDSTKKPETAAAGHTEGSAPTTDEAPPADPPQE